MRLASSMSMTLIMVEFVKTSVYGIIQIADTTKNQKRHFSSFSSRLYRSSRLRSYYSCKHAFSYVFLQRLSSRIIQLIIGKSTFEFISTNFIVTESYRPHRSGLNFHTFIPHVLTSPHESHCISQHDHAPTYRYMSS